MISALGPCGVEGCPNQADRRTAHGLLCPAHRKRLQPSRVGGKKLFEPVAQKLEAYERLIEAAMWYANAEEDEDFAAGKKKLVEAARAFAPQAFELAEQLAEECRRRAIREGMARARGEGRVSGPRPQITEEELRAALEQGGSIRKAAALMGRPRRSVQKAMRRIGMDGSHGQMHGLGGMRLVPPPDEPQVPPPGEVDGVGEGQGDLRPQREGRDGGGQPEPADVG